MRRAKFGLTILAAICGCISTAAAESQSRSYEFARFEKWLVNAVGDAEGVHLCVAEAASSGDVQLVFGVDEAFGWQMSLFGNQWGLKQQDHFELQYMLDDGVPVKAEAIAFGESSVVINLGRESAVIEPFKDGKSLEITAAKGGFKFDLAGSRAALEAAYDCMLRNGGRSFTAKQNPFSAEPTPQPPALTQPAAPRTAMKPEVEAILVGDMILNEAGLSNPNALLPGDPDVMPGYHQTWKLEHAKAGVVVQYDIPPQATDVFLQRLENQLRASCPSPVLLDRPGGISSPILGRLRFACSRDHAAAMIFLLTRPWGGTYAFVAIGDPNPEGGAAAEALDAKVAQALASARWLDHY